MTSVEDVADVTGGDVEDVSEVAADDVERAVADDAAKDVNRAIAEVVATMTYPRSFSTVLSKTLTRTPSTGSNLPASPVVLSNPHYFPSCRTFSCATWHIFVPRIQISGMSKRSINLIFTEFDFVERLRKCIIRRSGVGRARWGVAQRLGQLFLGFLREVLLVRLRVVYIFVGLLRRCVFRGW
jgi:hypothetical protein